MIKKAIVVMAIGEKHSKQFDHVKNEFQKYANFCEADLLICNQPPDPSFNRNILSQKLLLPSLCTDYDWMAFFDLDIIFSKNSESIFDHIDNEKSFGAIVDPRSSQKFINVANRVWKLPEVSQETHLSYFQDRGFNCNIENRNKLMSINGGVFMCKPRDISEIFKSAYFSNFQEIKISGGNLIYRNANTNEEAIMSYETQSRDMFFEINETFNMKFIYEAYEDVNSEIVMYLNSEQFSHLAELHEKNDSKIYYPEVYSNFISKTLDRCTALHFAGGYPFKHLQN